MGTDSGEPASLLEMLLEADDSIEVVGVCKSDCFERASCFLEESLGGKVVPTWSFISCQSSNIRDPRIDFGSEFEEVGEGMPPGEPFLDMTMCCA